MLPINKFKIGSKAFINHTCAPLQESLVGHRFTILSYHFIHLQKCFVYAIRFETGPWAEQDRLQYREDDIVADNDYTGPRHIPKKVPEPEVTRSMLELYLKVI